MAYVTFLSPFVNYYEGFPMETGNKSDLLAGDIVLLLPSLAQWSNKGFQHFIESGCLSDVIEAVKSKKCSILKVRERGMVGLAPSFERGTVKLTQLKRLLDVVSSLKPEEFDSFVRAFKIWSIAAPLFDTNFVSWELRDDWRQEMGLRRISPVYIVGLNRFVFKRTGHCGVWGKHPPEGYRYATYFEIGEAHIKKLESESSLSVIFFKDGHWCRPRSSTFSSVEFYFLTESEVTKYFNSSVFFIPLQKL